MNKSPIKSYWDEQGFTLWWKESVFERRFQNPGLGMRHKVLVRLFSLYVIFHIDAEINISKYQDERSSLENKQIRKPELLQIEDLITKHVQQKRSQIFKLTGASCVAKIFTQRLLLLLHWLLFSLLNLVRGSVFPEQTSLNLRTNLHTQQFYFSHVLHF